MEDTILLGRGKEFSRIPRQEWEESLLAAPQLIKKRLDFMSEDHHAVRNYVVQVLPRLRRPVSPATISQSVGLTVPRTLEVLAELEKRLFFLVRNQHGDVSWAFPVTAESTGHRLSFSTGERLDAAWAEDAVATPFVQGHLRNTELETEIDTVCGHCDAQIRLSINSGLDFEVLDGGSQPLVFEPEIQWDEFTDPNIIDGYWRKSLFFWSEEHAREFREKTDQVAGTYLTLSQSVFSTRVVQGSLFGMGL